MAVIWKDLHPFNCVCGRVKNPEEHFTCDCFNNPQKTEEELKELKINYAKEQISEKTKEISTAEENLLKLKKVKEDFEEALQEINGNLFS